MDTITLKSNNQVVEITASSLMPNTFLHTLVVTAVRRDMGEEGQYILDDIPFRALNAYKEFLEFRTDFEWDNEIEEWFDYLGHPNVLNYPNDFYKVKLIDDRVRECHNTYSKTLIKLTPNIKFHSRIDEVLRFVGKSLPEGHYIAGGAALYIAGITDKYSDIDIFTCNRKATENWITTVFMNNGMDVTYSGNCISSVVWINGSEWKEVQIILREYNNPSEIIHGFDIGSCSILYDHTKGIVLTTHKGQYCFTNKINWFEPDRSSPSYAFRLAKYHMRGFRIMLPCVEDLKTSIISFEQDIFKAYHMHKDYCLGWNTDNSRTNIALAIHNVRNKLTDAHNVITFHDPNSVRSKEIMDMHTRALDLIPKDPMSIIILASCYSISPTLLDIPKLYPDYASMKATRIRDLSTVKWKTINPMEQVLSGTFYPEPILMDVRQFYLSSPLVMQEFGSTINTKVDYIMK